MKKILLTLACAVITPLAFAQTSGKTTTQTTNPVAGSTDTTTTTTIGTVITFEAGKTIAVRGDGATDPISLPLGKTVHYVNKAGKEVEASVIRLGAHVHVYYDHDGDTQVVSRVVVDED